MWRADVLSLSGQTLGESTDSRLTAAVGCGRHAVGTLTCGQTYAEHMFERPRHARQARGASMGGTSGLQPSINQNVGAVHPSGRFTDEELHDVCDVLRRAESANRYSRRLDLGPPVVTLEVLQNWCLNWPGAHRD